LFTKNTCLILLIIFTFTGCNCQFYDTNKRKYNELSRQHNQIANEAAIKKDEAVDYYDVGKYEESKKAAEEAKNLFIEAKNISEQSKEIAANIEEAYWLVGYKEKQIEAEGDWIEIMKIVISACNAQIKGNLSQANSLVLKLEKKIKEYQKLEKEIEKIKKDHQDFFDGGN